MIDKLMFLVWWKKDCGLVGADYDSINNMNMSISEVDLNLS